MLDAAPIPVSADRNKGITPQDLAANAETPEARLIRQWHELADPVREQRAKAQYDQAAEHRVQREGLFGGMAQLREEKARELAGIPEIHRDSLIALEIGKAHESLEKRQAQERKTLQSSLASVFKRRRNLMNAQPEEPQDLIPAVMDGDTFVQLHAASRSEAERLYGAVYDQAEAEVNHG